MNFQETAEKILNEVSKMAGLDFTDTTVLLELTFEDSFNLNLQQKSNSENDPERK